MTRKHSLAVAFALGLVLVLAWWRPWSSSSESEPEPEATTSRKPSLKKAPDSRDMSPVFEVLADDDAIGTLRLEGMVVDDAMVGIGGATVTVSSNPPRTIKTQEDGSFHFDKLGGRTYRLVARTGEGAAGPVTANLTATSDPVTLVVKESSSIEVVVLSAANRKPISGATVELRGPLVERSSTDADGVARLTAIPSGRFQVAAWSPGHATARSRVRLGSTPSTYKVELLLSEGSSVSGVVVDSAGAAVSGAKVLYASVSERRNRAHPLLDAVVTGEDGTFVVPALPKGTWRIRARHKTHAPGTSEPITLDGSTPVTGVQVQLQMGAVLRGTVVTADGAPAAQARVRAAVGGRRGRGGGRPRQTFADDDGKFELEGLPMAEISIVALHESATSETTRVDSSDSAAATAIVLTLDRTGRIAGRVVDGTGEPVDGAQVRLMPDFRGGARFSRQDLRLRGISTQLTDPGGNFDFRGLDDTPYRLSAAPAGSAPSRGRAGSGVTANIGELDVELTLEARGGIKGKVAFANGEAPAAFTVATGRGRRAAPVPFSNKDGSFELTELEPQTTTLRIVGPSFDTVTRAGLVVEPGRVIDLGTVTVRQGRRVAGVVVDASGSAVENATVVIGARLRGSGQSTSASGGRRGLGAQNKETTTDEKGEFVLSGISESALALVAEHPSKGRSKSLALPQTSESSTAIKIVLEPPGALAGKVTLDGKPVEGVRVSARSKTATGATFSVGTAEDGTYRFDVLAPDSYLVSASMRGRGPGPGPGFGSISKSTTITSGKTTSLELRFSAGSAELSVNASGPEDGLGFGLVTLVDGDVSATNLIELDAFLAARDGGYTGRGAIRAGQAAEFAELQPGAYTACIVALPDEVFGPSAFEYIEREAPNLKLFCASVTLSGGDASIAVPVVVPDFVPAPSE